MGTSYKTQLRPALNRIDTYVVPWLRRKFKRLGHLTKGAKDWCDRQCHANTRSLRYAMATAEHREPCASSSPKVCCSAQVAEVAGKHGATRLQIYDWRRRFRQRGELPSCEAPQPPFAPLVVEGPLEERHVLAVKLEIAIGDVVVRTDAAIDGEQLSRVIRAVRASR
ncbi:hypothetical protein QA640_37730 [Bradyrhizobium sp. CB82]|uniref:hypothetical protein n=1 Tax=Bradyrhizobium sp. CB82 TaxID=3039159 RepID=UPI0024B0E5BF|nr:hypothetical protein [Bradyrhizobium sp. CB82]WFU39962.1 hypothetical protein QA640_37730 [Bradyrhizobium sp. CB82]